VYGGGIYIITQSLDHQSEMEEWFPSLTYIIGKVNSGAQRKCLHQQKLEYKDGKQTMSAWPKTH